MRIGLDLLYLLPGETGGREAYARELIPQLRRQAPDMELVAFVSRDAGHDLGKELGDDIATVVLPASARSRAQWAVGELAMIARAAHRSGVDLVHSLANFAPIHGRFKRVVTIHDLQYRAVPELSGHLARAATSVLVSAGAHRADRVITVSHSAAREVRSGLRISADRIDVVPNGVRPVSPPGERPSTLPPTGERALVLAVATNLPHKNLPRLIQAAAAIPSAKRPLLVLAGHGTDHPSLGGLARAEGVADTTYLLGAVSPGSLEWLYASADCLVLASLHEGFGLPVLEAMSRSVPVACSDLPALREVADGTALYFDPRSPSRIAARIQEILNNPALASHMRETGRERASRFSWSHAAKGTLASYRRALASHQAPGSLGEELTGARPGSR
jgi:glycosyltransferase involved in cell wall biosynthesis